jgi:hypothetical protein
MKAPSTFFATFPGEASVIKKTATDTRIIVISSNTNRLTINFAIFFPNPAPQGVNSYDRVAFRNI